MRGNVFFMVCIVKFFSGCCFYVDVVKWYVVVLGNNFMYSSNMWCYFRCLCYNGYICII